MTELETRLTDALKALSTQWDADQQQHAEELDILRARIDDLAQLVTDLRGAARATRRGLGATSDRLAGAAAAAAQHAGGDLNGAVRTTSPRTTRRSPPCWRRNEPDTAAHRADVERPGPLGLSRQSHRTTLDELEHPSDYRPDSFDIS